MVRNQDDASFISWTATLHPESAVSSIAPQLQNHPNAWAAVYHETCSDVNYENMPVAVVVPVDDDHDIEANPQQPREQISSPQHTSGLSSDLECPPGSADNRTGASPSPRPQPWKHSNFVDLIIGFGLAIASFIFTVKIELSAILIYTMAAGCHYLAEEVFTSTPSLFAKSV